MGFLAPPKPESATSVASAQRGQNLFNTQLSQASLVNQQNPYQSLFFQPGDIDPATGLRRYTANTQLSPENQGLLNTQYGTRQNIGGGLASLLGDINLGENPDLSTAAGSLTDQMLQRHLGYMQPYFNFEQNSLENRLRNQGASDNAYNYANMQAGDNRSRNIMQAINTFEPMAFEQALKQYQTPINTIMSLFDKTNPITPDFLNTPTFQQQAPNMSQLSQQEYSNKLGAYNNMISGLFGMGSAVMGMPLGTAAGAVPTVGSKIGGSIAGMFG